MSGPVLTMWWGDNTDPSAQRNLMTVAAISPATNEAQSELVKYQEKLAADLADKAASKTITADKNAVAQAQIEIQQARQAQQLKQAERVAAEKAQEQVNEARMTTGTGTTGLTKTAGAVSGSIDTTV
jgi:hypothetical protein